VQPREIIMETATAEAEIRYEKDFLDDLEAHLDALEKEAKLRRVEAEAAR
jgi:hypothetical protein